MSTDLRIELAALDAVLTGIETTGNADAKRAQTTALESESDQPELRSDPEAAHQASDRLSRLHAEMRDVAKIRRRLDDVAALYYLAVADDDADTHAAARREIIQLRGVINELQLRTMPSGE